MSLAEIENLLLKLQAEVKANTAAIVTLNNTVSNYATTDDLTAISKQINTLQNNNVLLQDAVSALNTSVAKIDHLSRLQDIVINNITEGDILQYSSDGKWHNIQLSGLDINTGTDGTSSVTKLSDLTDVFISGVSNGQALVYSSINNKWINATIQSNGGNTGDMSSYLTIKDAQLLYLPLTGGTITGPLTVTGLTNLGDNLLVTGGITMYNK